MWNESFCPCVNRKMHLDFRTGVIKSNFQAFKILRWPVLASLKIEKKGIKVRYSRQLRTSSNRLFFKASVISDNSHAHR